MYSPYATLPRTLDLYDAQFEGETRLGVDASGLVLSRVVFAGPVEIRALRAQIEASETTFTRAATIAALDETRRPERTGLKRVEAARASVRSLRRTDVSMLTPHAVKSQRGQVGRRGA